MAHRIGACAATLGVAGAGLAGAGALLRPEGPPIGGEPAWWSLPLLGGSMVAAAILIRLLAAGRDDQGDGMLSGLLLGTDRAALLVAGGGTLVLGGALLAADAGLMPRDAQVVGVSAPDWALYGGASLLALFLVALGLCAWAWSAGRGTRARKAGAVRNHVLAAALALAPWTIRALFGG